MKKKFDWEKDWLEYCRTYLIRYGINDEVAIRAIAGNLEQVVKKYLSDRDKLWQQKLREAIGKMEMLIPYVENNELTDKNKYAVLGRNQFRQQILKTLGL